MKLLNKTIISLLLVILFISCEESFSPIGEFNESYVLSCVLRGDNGFQEAILTKTYFADGIDPFTNSDDPVIKDAVIKIWLNPDSVIIMNDSTVSADSAINNSSDYFYYVKNFKPGFGQNLRIEALLPTGQRLVGITSTPKKVEFNRQSDTKLPMDNKNSVQLSWIANEADLYYFPRLTFNYFKDQDGKRTEFVKEIPMNYVLFNGAMVPRYPRASDSPSLTIQHDALNRVMQEISEGDLDKNSYSINIQANLDVLVLDKNLKSYYQATLDGLDQFTVRLDGSDFTNIKGGLGIFGSYLKISKQIPFGEDFISSFGYNTVFD